MNQARYIFIGVALATCAFGAARTDGAKEKRKDALRQGIKQQTEAEDWEKASSSIRKLLRMTKGEEKDELSVLLERVNGEKAWVKIVEAHGSSKAPRRILKKIEEFRKEFGEHSHLARRAEELRSLIRSDLIYMIEGFETGGLDADRGRTVLESADIKEGKQALRWTSKDLEMDYLYVYPDRTDWTGYSYLCMWIYSEEPQTSLQVTAITKYDAYWPEQYSSTIRLDFKGWRRIRLALRGKRRSFAKSGRADWASIDSICLIKEEGKRLNIILDEICLEKE
ncbi:MAG: chondroitinase family protein [Planctomycetota bacterium]|nr:chondroitinase family protein [Planctomycetota bacterium]